MLASVGTDPSQAIWLNNAGEILTEPCAAFNKALLRDATNWWCKNDHLRSDPKRRSAFSHQSAQ